MSDVPRSVLADALKTELNGATLHAAVLTTFTLDWDFVVDQVLPVFVPHDLSANDVTRREELAQHLQQNQAVITVFVDAKRAGEASGASRVPMAVVPVRHPTGCFHPKVILALVTDGGGSDRLVVGVGSANLTRSGWWEWVECAHLWSIEDSAATWCRHDLLSFVAHLEKQASTASAKLATKQVRAFLARTHQRLRHSAGDSTRPGRFHWNGLRGRPSFVDALTGFVKDSYVGGTLEVVSPWYSDSGDAQVRDVATALGVREGGPLGGQVEHLPVVVLPACVVTGVPRRARRHVAPVVPNAQPPALAGDERPRPVCRRVRELHHR